MTGGVWEIGTARLCIECCVEMEKEYLIRPTRQQTMKPALDRWERGLCERCGKEKPMTKKRRFLMRGKVKRERGLDKPEILRR